MRKTKEEAEKTKSIILKAALNVMNDKGIGATRYEDIAIEANVTRGAIYHYFKNKNEIILAIHHNYKKQMIELFQRHVSEKIDPVISLKEGLKEILKRFKEDEEFRVVEELFIKAEFASLVRGDTELHKAFEEEKKETINDLFQLLKRGQDLGSFRKDIKTESLTYAFISFYVGYITTWFFQVDSITAENIVDDYIDILLHGFLK